MKNKTWKNYLGAAALVTVLFAGSVSAYFTDQDEKVNTFTVGKVTIELEEPKWEKKPDDNGNKIPDEAERMTPNQTIIKDPQVKNTGNNDAFIYMTVEVPCRQIISVNNDGTRNPLAMRELYNYQVDNSWELLGTVDVSDESGKKVAVKHLYAYAGAQGICTVVKPQETTKPYIYDKPSSTANRRSLGGAQLYSHAYYHHQHAVRHYAGYIYFCEQHRIEIHPDYYAYSRIQPVHYSVVSSSLVSTFTIITSSSLRKSTAGSIMAFLSSASSLERDTSVTVPMAMPFGKVPPMPEVTMVSPGTRS